MPGRAVAVSLVLFLSAGAAFPQCDFTQRYSGQYRSSVLDIAIDGNDLWAATSYGVQLFDRSVTPPRSIDLVAIPGITRVVRASAGISYAGSGSAIFVLRRSGDGIAIVNSVDAGGTVNDLLLAAGYLYAATSNGVVQFSLGDAANPARTLAQFETSPNVGGLASQGSTLYIADLDSSVEVFSISNPASPQRTGTLSSLPRSESVAIGEGGRIYISDGQSTDIFFSSGPAPTKVATVALGATSFARLAGHVGFVAGADRRLQAVDFTLPANPVRLFEAEIATAGGTIDRIGALLAADGRLYAAAGDAGLVVYDISAFTSPFPVQALGGGATTTIVSAGNKFYVAKAAGGFIEYSRGSNGHLTLARTWETRVGAVHEVTDSGFLLTSSDRVLTYWTLNSSSPASVITATFRQAISSAVLSGSVAYVVLEDRSLWSANLTQLTPAPQQIATPGVSPSAIARSNTALAIADIRDDRSTRIAFYPTADFGNPRLASVDGIATAGVALSGTTAAVFTFRGITTIDFASTPAMTAVLAESNLDLVRSISLRGNTLVSLDQRTLSIWDLTTRRRARRIALPAEGVAVHVPAGQALYADIATNDGVATVAYTSASQAPALRSIESGNRYYKDASAAGDRLYLFDGQSVDVFSTAFGSVPNYLMTIRVPGMVDFAISAENVFVLSGSRTVHVYTSDGVLLNQTTLPDTLASEALRVEAVGGVPWVAVARGCPTACEKATLVLDPRSLVSTSTLSGAVTDVVMAGTGAYALFEIPAEVRVIDIGDPLHPAPLVNRATEGALLPVAIAHANGIVYVLGDRLYAYSESDLNNIGTQFEPYANDITSSFTYVDQRLSIDGGCALVSGRSFSPQFFAVRSAAQWNALSTIPVPATAKALPATPGRLFVLTNYSIEVLSTTAPAQFPRRRAVR